MRLKIISDGTAAGTQVIDADSGLPIENIRSITWDMNPHQLASVTLVVDAVAVDLDADDPAIVYVGRDTP